ncbi:UNVERIFIED_ORG: polysaccharide pyruvyl transferase WcaK-like protein [Peribacillus simplex]
MKKVLYIGWIGYKNLGDDLMFDLFKQNLISMGENYKLDVVNNEKIYLEKYPLDPYDLIVLGGGSILSGPGHIVNPVIINTLYKAISLNKKVMIWGSGIDWVPKEFIESLKNNKELNLMVAENVKNKVKDVFEKSAWAGVRGPLTLDLLKSIGINMNKIHVSGDPGFLLRKNISKINTINQNSVGNKEEKIIGVNWGTTYNIIYGKDEIKVEDQLVSALQALIQKGYKIYLFIVWGMDLEATERLYNKINNEENVILDINLHHQDELISIIENFSFTINFKLHSNYISLAAHVPFVALGYRFKVFDFVKSSGLDEFIISTDSNTIVEQIINLESIIAKNRSSIINTMKIQQNLYSQRIRVPFENNLYI